MDALEPISSLSGPGQPWTLADLAGPARPGGAPGVREESQLPADERIRDEQEKQIGRDFESVLLTKLFEQVQASIEDSGFDEEDSGAQQVRGMFWLYLAQDVADKGGLGLGKDIYQHIKQMEDVGGLTRAVDEEL